VYEAVSYEGEPEESEEMRPRWFKVANLPLKAREDPRATFSPTNASNREISCS